MKKIKITEERYLPSQRYVDYEHWHRYYWVLDMAKDKKILDITCGEGYGSNIMADAAREVIGVDLDGETISEAKSRYKNPNIRYLAGSATQIPLAENNSFDLIVSFETLKHIDEQQQVVFLNEVKRLLKPEGLFYSINT